MRESENLVLLFGDDFYGINQLAIFLTFMTSFSRPRCFSKSILRVTLLKVEVIFKVATLFLNREVIFKVWPFLSKLKPLQKIFAEPILTKVKIKALFTFLDTFSFSCTFSLFRRPIFYFRSAPFLYFWAPLLKVRKKLNHSPLPKKSKSR